MNFNYSYRAFLITSLLFGILFLLMTSINLSKYKEKAEEIIDVDYTIDESVLEEDEEDLAIIKPPSSRTETHRAFNEAEKFIKEIEQEREELTESTEGKIEAIDAAIEDSQTANNGDEITAAKKLLEKKETTSNGTQKKKKVSVIKSSNRNSTNSYRLVNRSAMYFPNPVYTCEGGGKIVISIEVNTSGRVKKVSYNSKQSETTNQCLIDSALEYAKLARFSTDASREIQLGTITYNFPGQN